MNSSIMLRLHECYDRLYYLHSSMYDQNDWYNIETLRKQDVNHNTYMKNQVKQWLGIHNTDITVSHNRHGIVIYGSNPMFPIFFVSAVDFTIYYFLLDIERMPNNILKSYYFNLFKHIRSLENSIICC